MTKKIKKKQKSRTRKRKAGKLPKEVAFIDECNRIAFKRLKKTHSLDIKPDIDDILLQTSVSSDSEFEEDAIEEKKNWEYMQSLTKVLKRKEFDQN